MKSKIKIFTTALCSVLLFTHCNFLDIVPDNTVEIGSLFQNRESALTALSTVYWYIPQYEKVHESMSLAGDEWVGRLDAGVAESRSSTRGEKLMRGWNNSSDPIMNYWGNGGGVRGLYRGIRIANIFLDNIGGVPGATPQEVADWTAQVKFLKAWYHFYLVRLYGPIVIADENLEPSASIEDVRQHRQSIDTCFDYIIGLMDEVINSGHLLPERPAAFLGQIDMQVAKAARAEVLLTRASPLFNGNSEFYSNFRGINGELLFPLEYSAQKWKDALDAIEEAITYAKQHGKAVYHFTGQPKFWDTADFENSEIIQYAYNNRFSIVDNWNSEMIWGFSGIDFEGQGGFAHGSNMRSAAAPNTPEYAWQWLGGSYAMVERFYSRNGLPIEDDITFHFENRREQVTIPGFDDTYHLGYMQVGSGRQTVQLHLNREPRFYAWMAVDGGIWRTHDLKNNVGMRFNEFEPSGRTQLGGRNASHTTDFYWTGIGVKKMVHPESGTGHWARVVKYTYPIIRISDLYLMYAEAYNEYHGPGQPAYDKLNAIRARGGLKPVEQVWSNPAIAGARVLNSHLTKDGLREIIHRERSIELSFEGKRYFDVLRWKKAGQEFTSPVQGWNTLGADYQTFYILMTLQPRVWQTPRDYLMPIPLNDLNRNPNLVQNPGW
jgi:hypothetical protein